MPNQQQIVFEILQVISLIFAILTIYFTIKRSIINKKWWFDIPMLTLMVHGAIFYFALFIVRIFDIDYTPVLLFTSWSSLLRFHGYGTLLVIAYSNLKREELK